MPATKSDLAEQPQSPFIFVTGNKTDDNANRKFIRRHVMLGRNKGKTRGPKAKDLTDTRLKAELEISTFKSAILSNQAVLPLTNTFCSGLSFIEFSEPVDRSLIADVIRFMTISKKALFPLEQCITFGHDSGGDWLERMTVDAALLHAIIFCSQDYFLRVAQDGAVVESAVSKQHSLKTVQLLRQRLSSDDVHSKTSDATMSVIFVLAMHCHMLGQAEAARGHMLGLNKIVNMRGGLQAMRRNPKLLHEILRTDINIALDNGTTPTFFQDPVLEPFWPLPTFLDAACSQNLDISDFTNDEISKLWRFAGHFATFANITYLKGDRHSVNMLLDTLTSLVYRLLNLRFELDTIAEAVRLGLLSFCTGSLLQWRDAKLSYRFLQARYHDCLLRLPYSARLPHSLWLWLLVVGASSFPEEHTMILIPLLQGALEDVELNSWLEVKQQMVQCVWIDFLFDQPVQKFFRKWLPSIST